MGAWANKKIDVSNEITTGGELTAVEHVALLHSIIDLIIAQLDPDDDGFLDLSRLQGLTGSGNSKYVGTSAAGVVGIYDLPDTTLTQSEFNSLLSTQGPLIVTLFTAQVAEVSQAEYEAGTSTDIRQWTPAKVKAAIQYHGGLTFYDAGSPEGSQVGSPGDSYWDTTNNVIYFKEVGTGNTGWVQHATSGSAGNSFETINTPAGTDPVADSSTDTLNLASGNTILTITGDSSTDTVTFAIVETEIDHDNLNNFVADEHVDHSSVSITAGEGLTGGGDITTTRSIDFDVNGLTADGTPDGAADYVATYDASAGSHKKVLLNDLPGGGASGGTNYSGAGSPEGVQTGSVGETYWDTTNDVLYYKETGAGTNTGWVQHATGAFDISALTETTDTPTTSDYAAVHDDSSGGERKIRLPRLLAPASESYSTTLTFDRNKEYASHTQTGAITFTLAGSGNIPGVFIRSEIVADGTNAINLPAEVDFAAGVIDGQPLASGTYEFWFIYRADGGISVSVPGGRPPTKTVSSAASMTFAANEAIYFDLTLTNTGATAGVTNLGDAKTVLIRVEQDATPGTITTWNVNGSAADDVKGALGTSTGDVNIVAVSNFGGNTIVTIGNT